MAGTAGKWLGGCALGCGALAVLGIVLAVGGLFWLHGTIKGFDEAIASRRALEERFGRSDEFVPWPDGAIPADRMEVFLGVREDTDAYRKRIAKFFSMVPDRPEEVKRLESRSFVEKLLFGLRMGRAGIGLAEQIAEFFHARNGALEKAGMGPGEYAYIYVTAYYAWLGHSPSDEPGGGHVRVRVEGAGEAFGHDGGWQSSRVRRDFLAQLRNLRDGPGPKPSGEWGRRLSDEIAALEEDRQRAPWADGLPEAIRLSLEPYRDRLEETYSPATNPFELARNERQGIGVRAD